MHNDKDFPLGADDLDDEIEIEFVDVDDTVEEGETVAAPVVEEPTNEVAISEVAPEDEVDKLRTELEHVRDIYLRKLAEFDNFRKRVDKERAETRQIAAEDVVRELLPVLDNFERALQHSDDGTGAFRDGVEMIAKQLWDTLERRGVEGIEAEGKTFDPEVHEAVQRVEDSDKPPGTIVFVMLKGYTLGDRLIRPALVGVAVEPENVEGGGGGQS
jgi:molecular chaperone GrpE